MISRESLALFAAAAAIAGVLAALLVALLDLAPPESMRMAAGRAGGGYHAFAERYRVMLARDRIRLEIVETAGSVENARLLAEGRVDAALLQGGVDPPEGAGIEAVAAVFLEPLFVFHRGALGDAADPAAWRGLRVAAGEEGSGTRAAVERATRALGLDLPPSALAPLGGAAAAEALQSGSVDAAVFVAPTDAPYLQPLYDDRSLVLAPLRDPQALARRLPYVRMVDIPAAGLDYARRIPEARVPLVAMVARLAVSPDLHPALVDRLANAAEAIHAGPSLVSSTARFPSAEGTGLPMNRQAADRLEDGPSALHDLLPYWFVAQINRFALLLVPAIVLLLPLLRALPGLYAWTMRKRVWRRYEELMRIEKEAEGGLDPERRRQFLRRLDVIETEARAVNVPQAYRENVYTLRLHIDLVRRKLRAATQHRA